MDQTWLIIWLVIFVILVVIEMITTGVTAVWFGCGALAGAVCAVVGAPVWVQIVVFAGVSFLLVAFVRPGVKRRFDRSRRQSAQRKLIGTRALVISEIDNLRGIGEVRVGDREWAARSYERGVAIPEGAIVRVLDVHGDVMLVRMDDSLEFNMELRDSEARLDPSIRDRF